MHRLTAGLGRIAVLAGLHVLVDQQSARDIYRHQWTRLSDPEQVAKALELLVDLDQLAACNEETAGRARGVYTENPRALSRSSMTVRAGNFIYPQILRELDGETELSAQPAR